MLEVLSIYLVSFEKEGCRFLKKNDDTLMMVEELGKEVKNLNEVISDIEDIMGDILKSIDSLNEVIESLEN